MWDERSQDWFVAMNPKASVPVAKFGSVVLNESNTITAYIADKYGRNTGFYPATAEGVALVLLKC